MPAHPRKVEVHKLTISGLKQRVGYSDFLSEIHENIEDLGSLVMNQRTRSHALYKVSAVTGRLQLRFLSFAEGFRPDVLSTQNYHVSPNPLNVDQTNVIYTHVLGGIARGKFLFLIEKCQGGIFPRTIETYLNWFVEKYGNNAKYLHDPGEGITVSLEAVASESFITRLNNLSRIKTATVRTVQPNPGWADLETSLSEQAKESDAQKADVTMHAPHAKSLAKNKGIIATIVGLFGKKELDYAKVEGKNRSGQDEAFSTEKHPKMKFLKFENDDKGQTRPDDAFDKLSDYMDELK